PVIELDAFSGGVSCLISGNVAIAGVHTVVITPRDLSSGFQDNQSNHQGFLIEAVEFRHSAEDGANMAAPESRGGFSGSGLNAAPEFLVGDGGAVAGNVHEDGAGCLSPCVNNGVVGHGFSFGVVVD